MLHDFVVLECVGNSQNCTDIAMLQRSVCSNLQKMLASLHKARYIQM